MSSKLSNLADVDFSIKQTFNVCPFCRNPYDFFRRDNISKCPLIITCGHTVCEDCIKTMCTTNNTVCPICSKKFTVLRSQLDNLSDVFSPHFALMGYIVYTRRPRESRNEPIGWAPTGLTVSNRKCNELQDLGPNMSSTDLTFVFNRCQIHSDQLINIECLNCNDYFCCYCFLENHSGHISKCLYKMDENEMIQLDKYKYDVEVILGHLLSSKKKVQDLKTFDTTSLDRDLRNKFSHLHAKLHFAELRIRKEIDKLEPIDDSNDLDEFSQMLQTAIERVNRIIPHFTLLTTNAKQINVSALFNEIQQLKKLSCRLISEEEHSNPFRVHVSRVLENLEELVELKSNSLKKYSFEKITDWSQVAEKIYMDEIKKYNCDSQSSSQHTETIPQETVTIIKKNFIKAKPVSERKFRAVVTHINNLDSFFIQKFSSIRELKLMNNDIERRFKRKPNDLRLGGIYGTGYVVKNQTFWRRGKLLEIKNEGDSITHRMFFIDYGNTQWVTIDKIRNLNIALLQRSSYAIECRLNLNDEQLDPKAHFRLSKIIRNRELYINLIKEGTNGEVSKVDLFISQAKGDLISVKKLLTEEIERNDNEMQFIPTFEYFSNSIKFEIGQEVEVVVVYIRDPFHICIHLVQNRCFFEKLKNDMEKYYSSSKSLQTTPTVDLNVVVKFHYSENGKFHRAQILSVNEIDEEVDVLLVDCGRQVTVHWTDLRQLTEEFIRMEKQAIIVKLAEIVKKNDEDEWPIDSIQFLNELCTTKEQFKMMVHKLEPLEVTIFQHKPSADVCVNSILVERKLVHSSGQASQTIYWPQAETHDEDDGNDLAFQMIKKSEKIILDDETDEHEEENHSIRQQVTIMKYESPDLIHIKLLKYQEQQDQLCRDLQIHYSSSEAQIKNQWKINEKCVILDREQNTYYRGVIKQQKKNYCIVYLYDEVREFKLCKQFIYIYDHYFDSYPCCVIKCSIGNIKPAGDSKCWSQTAIEIVGKIFSVYKLIFIEKIGIDIKRKLLNVNMWYCITKTAKALEPSRVKYLGIDRCLIESGVAFNASPTHQQQQPAEKVVEAQNWYDMVMEVEEKISFHHTKRDVWPPASSIKEIDFMANVHCIDHHGFFHIRDDETTSSYKALEKRLNQVLNSITHRSRDNWKVDDMCSILFNGIWFRGTILKVLPKNHYNVEMIDFGSEHLVTKDDLSGCLMFLDERPLINKIRLFDLYCKHGEWTEDDVEQLIQIVPERVRVVIKITDQLEVPYAELYFVNGQSLNDHIADKHKKMLRRNNTIALGHFDTDDEDLNYTYMLHKDKLQVMNFYNYEDSFYVTLSSNESFIKEDKFIDLEKQIQISISSQPVLDSIEKAQCCIALHPDLNIWSRAVIWQLDPDNLPLVFFVDYGYITNVVLNNIRKIASDWMEVPVYTHIAQLNVDLLNKEQRTEFLSDLHLIKLRDILVRIISNKPLKVHLYEKGDKKLCYENYIICGIISAL